MVEMTSKLPVGEEVGALEVVLEEVVAPKVIMGVQIQVPEVTLEEITGAQIQVLELTSEEVASTRVDLGGSGERPTLGAICTASHRGVLCASCCFFFPFSLSYYEGY